MSISLEELKQLFKQAGIKYWRDNAPSNQYYPYLIYEYVGDVQKLAGNYVVREFQEYQLAYITRGIESELDVLKKVLQENGVLYSNFKGGSYDENDETITQFVTYVRCRKHG